MGRDALHGCSNSDGCAQGDKQLDVSRGSCRRDSCHIIRCGECPSKLNEDVLGDRKVKPIRNNVTERIARRLTPSGTGAAGETRAEEEAQVRCRQRRDWGDFRSTYQQSFWGITGAGDLPYAQEGASVPPCAPGNGYRWYGGLEHISELEVAAAAWWPG